MHTARPGRPAAVVVLSLTVLALLGGAVAAGAGPVLRVDRAVSLALYAGDGRSGLREAVLQVAASPGSSAFRAAVVLPALVWLVRRRASRAAGWVLVATALVGPLTTLLKELVGRPRPQFAAGGARLDSLSFPSGHASGAATLVTVALVVTWPLLSPGGRRRALAAGVALALLVGCTRMWLGVHFLSDVVGGWALGVAWPLLVALAFRALPGRLSGMSSRVLLEPDDGSLGPLLRMADDRLGADAGYGRHAHVDVDVVAVLLAGSLRHAWGRESVLGPGDVAVLRAGRGLEHDEVAGAGGAHVVQTYLRAAAPGAQPAHDVLLRPTGWVDLGRTDARLWLGPAGADVPAGLRVVVRGDEVLVGAEPVDADLVLVWQLDTARPAWAD